MVQSHEIKRNEPAPIEWIRRPCSPGDIAYESRSRGKGVCVFHGFKSKETRIQWELAADDARGRTFCAQKIHEFYAGINSLPAKYESSINSFEFGIELGRGSDFERISLESFIKKPQALLRHRRFEQFKVMNLYSPQARIVYEPFVNGQIKATAEGNMKVFSRQDLTIPLVALMHHTSRYDFHAPFLEERLRVLYKTVFSDA